MGQTLSVDAGSWTLAITGTHQWLRCDASGAGCTAISGATGSTYTPGEADRGARLRVRVTGSILLPLPNWVLTDDSAVVT